MESPKGQASHVRTAAAPRPKQRVTACQHYKCYERHVSVSYKALIIRGSRRLLNFVERGFSRSSLSVQYGVVALPSLAYSKNDFVDNNKSVSVHRKLFASNISRGTQSVLPTVAWYRTC